MIKKVLTFRKLLKCVLLICCCGLIKIAFYWDSIEPNELHSKPTVPVVSAQAEQKKSDIPIGFLKVHKAASTTIQNILIRYGLSRNLTFVIPSIKLPPDYSHVISIRKPLTQRDIVPAPYGKSYDILCHHTIYDKNTWKSVLGSDTFTVGIVREPVSHFHSSLQYFKPRHIQRIQSPDRVEMFLQNPHIFEVDVPNSPTNNRMSFEFGVNESTIWKRDVEVFSKYLNDVLDREFDVVIVAEKFAESLILMKRKLKWTLKDIIYIRKNTFSSKYTLEWSLNKKLIPLLKRHNALDFMLYDFFSKKIDKQIEDEKDDLFDDEVRTFKALCITISLFCRNGSNHGHYIVLNKTVWNNEFVWRRSDCDIMLMNEISITEKLRAIQYPDIR